MQVRQEIFDTYWRFAAMRQEVFFNRINNVPPPWTNDPILNTYKFCNAYRASDRVSQYLIKNVIYDERRSQNEEEVLFRILLFKIFNKIETWEYLESKIGDYITLDKFDLDVYANILQEAMNLGYVIYTSAYMSCASKEFGYDKKHQNHLALIDKMVVKDKVISQVVQAKTLAEVFHILQDYPLLGKFMAYQLATDINYSEITNFDENSFTIAGPGAERGINKCFIDTGGRTYSEIIHWMTENQEKEFQRLGLNFQSLWGRPLQAIDCQNLFCETDKYCRAAFPDLKSNRKKIKAKFNFTPQPIDYFYPPKWGINKKIKETLAQRTPDLDIPDLQKLNNSKSQQLSLGLDFLLETQSKITNPASKQPKKSRQDPQKRRSKLVQKTDIEQCQQLCLF
ncbi:nucleotide kinase domain-containing protein [Anabaena azotica]|uniref:5-hmdU DNA kinase helical domain-containing protein n=1 Tax=Anabaena azotica FACHB-119 TaxID=947527 RepID=A0ABR8CYE5_9NOST|nr:nucleotide kinase domain-containing protein [Anabaena azotica]MBD2499959.1 hypothetical protein [Anabaena azotica FACHB-119]